MVRVSPFHHQLMEIRINRLGYLGRFYPQKTFYDDFISRQFNLRIHFSGFVRYLFLSGRCAKCQAFRNIHRIGIGFIRSIK